MPLLVLQQVGFVPALLFTDVTLQLWMFVGVHIFIVKFCIFAGSKHFLADKFTRGSTRAGFIFWEVPFTTYGYMMIEVVQRWEGFGASRTFDLLNTLFFVDFNQMGINSSF